MDADGAFEKILNGVSVVTVKSDGKSLGLSLGLTVF